MGMHSKDKPYEPLETHKDYYKSLAYAIVEQAVEDYKKLYKVSPLEKRLRYKASLEKFFLSDWCYSLCGFDASLWEKFFVDNDYKKKLDDFVEHE